MTNVTQFM